MEYLLLEDLEREKMITLGRGNIISKIDINAIPGNYPIYSSSATGNGEFGRYGKYMFEDERVTWSIDGGGRPFYREKHKYSVTNVCGWLKINTDKLITKFVYYCLLFQWNMLKFDYTYKAHPSIIKEIYRIPMLPISIQKVIVEQLDKINNQISKSTNTLLYFEELTKSQFIEMFGTLNSPKFAFNYDVLENVCHKITDGKHGGCTFVKGTKKYFVGAREIYNDKINYETAPEISQDEFEKDYKRCNLQVNDFIIVNTGATIGKSAIVKDERAKDTLLQKSVALIKVREDILNNIFLKYCYIVNPEMYIVESGSAQPNLLLSKIKSTKIYIPNINMQNEFACFVEQIDKLKFNVQKQIKYYQELLDLKMHEYFDVEEED